MMLYKIWPFIVAAVFSCFLTVTQTQAQTFSSSDEIAIQDIIRDQIDAFHAKDHDRAFSHAAPIIKQIFKTSDRFVDMVKNGYQPLYNPDSYAFARNLEQGDSVYQEVIVTDQNGRQWQAVYTLQKQENGTWKITGVKMEPTQGAAT